MSSGNIGDISEGTLDGISGGFPEGSPGVMFELISKHK